MASSITSRRVLVVSFWVDVLDVVTNLTVALLTGCAVVFAEMTGRALPDTDLARLRNVVRATLEVEAINRLSAIYAGASEVLVDADLDLAEDLDTRQIEAVPRSCDPS